ncbi:MAG: hypothetical protein JO031_00005 [Ktedonobacteraceae bacterium]|nr:hypothetical protein [Ktedonobacteraceae bacterium]
MPTPLLIPLRQYRGAIVAHTPFADTDVGVPFRSPSVAHSFDYLASSA